MSASFATPVAAQADEAQNAPTNRRRDEDEDEEQIPGPPKSAPPDDDDDDPPPPPPEEDEDVPPPPPEEDEDVPPPPPEDDEDIPPPPPPEEDVPPPPPPAEEHEAPSNRRAAASDDNQGAPPTAEQAEHFLRRQKMLALMEEDLSGVLAAGAQQGDEPPQAIDLSAWQARLAQVEAESAAYYGNKTKWKQIKRTSNSLRKKFAAANKALDEARGVKSWSESGELEAELDTFHPDLTAQFKKALKKFTPDGDILLNEGGYQYLTPFQKWRVLQEAGCFKAFKAPKGNAVGEFVAKGLNVPKFAAAVRTIGGYKAFNENFQDAGQELGGTSEDLVSTSLISKSDKGVAALGVVGSSVAQAAHETQQSRIVELFDAKAAEFSWGSADAASKAMTIGDSIAAVSIVSELIGLVKDGYELVDESNSAFDRFASVLPGMAERLSNIALATGRLVRVVAAAKEGASAHSGVANGLEAVSNADGLMAGAEACMSIAAIAAGGFKMIKAAADIKSSTAAIGKLTALSETLTNGHFRDALDRAKTQQQLKRKAAVGSGIAGAGLVVGGILTLTLAASGVGFLVIAAAAALGGVVAVVKWWRTKQSNKKWAKAMLAKAYPAASEKMKDKEAMPYLMKLGYSPKGGLIDNAFDVFHNDVISVTAKAMHAAAFDESSTYQDEALAFIAALGLKTNVQNQTPSAAKIAKKIGGG